MNAKLTVSALLLAAFAGNALAETPTIVTEPFVSTQTRAQVQAELAAYKQAGVNPWSIQFDQLKAFRSSTSRQDVTAAYVADRDAVSAITGEDSGSAYFAQGATQARPGSTTLAGQPARAQ